MKHFLTAILISSTAVFGQTIGIRTDAMDKTVNPCSDFYMYCNGHWDKTFQLPETDARYGSFNEINNNNLKKIRVILDEVSANSNYPANSDLKKLHDFYTTAMDSARAEKLGWTPVLPQLQAIDKCKNVQELMALKSELDKIGVTLFFSGSAGADIKNSKRNVFTLSQGGYGLGNRDFYFKPQFEKIRNEYTAYLSRLFQLTGVSAADAGKQAKQVFDFELKLAQKSFTSLEMRDYQRMYNLYTREKLSALSPIVNWEVYFIARKIRQPDTVMVAMVDYFRELNTLLKSTPLPSLKLYAKAQVLNEASPFLSPKFEEVSFDFKGKTLSGAKQMKARWQRVQAVMDHCIGDVVSREFVTRHFTADARKKVDGLIDNLILSYRDRIASRSWMSEETKKQANRKLDLLIRKIGYPDNWKDYSRLAIGTGSYWENVCESKKYHFEENIAELDKPVDRNKWQMTPVTVNAYYDPSTNEITFPAAILQPPFFDPEAEDAANYGTMGSIIGHELTHGFDDQGSQFDADGNMNMWWTKQDYENFTTKKQLIVDQFNAYVALDTLHVNGSMTQGENIADLGGLTMAYYAYKKSLKGKPSLIMDGLSGEQRFFIAWAQGWKSKCRNEELKRLLAVDYHSPAYFRAFAPLSNMKEFYEAFGVKPGDKMYIPEEKRVEIW